MTIYTPTIKMKKILVPIILLILLLQLVSAELVVNKLTCNFALSSKSIDRKVCSCSNIEIPVKVDNVGDVEAIFDVTVISEQSDWFSIPFNSFNLVPGQNADTVVYAQVPCGWSGDVDYKIKVTTPDFGREKTIKGSLEVVNCNNVAVEGPRSSEVCPMELATTTFTVSNEAPFSDTYLLKVHGYNDYITLSENSFYLDQGESKEIFVYSKFPKQMFGDFDIPLTVTSNKNGQ